MPVDEAALDAFLADPTTAGGDAEGTPPAPATEPAATEPLPEGDTFPREYVEKLRRENASYRDRAKKYNDVFDGYEAEAVDEWLTLATTLKEDPKAAAERFAELADAIRSNYADPDGAAANAAVAAAEEVTGQVEEADKPLTRAEFNALMAEREKERDIQVRVVQIEADAKTLGYEKGSDDYEQLLWTASRLKSGSIQEAHEKMVAREQAIFDKKVKGIGGQSAPVVPDPNGAPASGERKLKTFKEANEALDEWLAGQSW